MWGSSENAQIRETTMYLILEAIKSDDKLTKSELEYIDDARQQLGLSQEKVKELNMAPDDYDLAIPMEESLRMTILYYVLFAIKADEEITKSEEALCQKISLKLGFSSMLTSELLDVLKANLHQQVPSKELLEKIKKYLN